MTVSHRFHLPGFVMDALANATSQRCNEASGRSGVFFFKISVAEELEEFLHRTSSSPARAEGGVGERHCSAWSY